MADKYFYCFRCSKHQKLEFKSGQVSPSGKSICLNCIDKIPKGSSTSRASRKLNKATIDYICRQIAT